MTSKTLNKGLPWWSSSQDHLSKEGKRVQSLVPEDPTSHGTTKPAHHNYCTQAPPLLKLTHLEPVLCKIRSYHNERPARHNLE